MPAKEVVVVIEDEPDILDVIDFNLTREGYRVHASDRGDRGLEMVRRFAPRLVVLDIMLPGFNGHEVCRQLKNDPVTASIPIIMVTAKSDESDVVLGLGLGADDYLAKPFSPKELVARVKAVLRRGPLQDGLGASERVTHGDLKIDARSHRVEVDGAVIELTATEFRLLHFLASHPDRIFSRDHLISRVIGESAVVGDRNIDTHVRSVRKKIGRYRDCIRTMRGVGYGFRSDLKA